jgi:hypothetical protein
MPTNINMSELATGDDIDAIAASKLTGALPAISGASLTNLPGGGYSNTAGGTSNFTFTPTGTSFLVTACGGGGGGNSGASNYRGGGGGAAYAINSKVTCTANSSVTVTIGTGGGTSSAGSATTFVQGGSTLASLGGGGGTVNGYYGAGGSGGTASGFTGHAQTGATGTPSGSSADTAGYYYGTGGPTPWCGVRVTTSLRTQIVSMGDKAYGAGGDVNNGTTGIGGFAVVLY